MYNSCKVIKLRNVRNPTMFLHLAIASCDQLRSDQMVQEYRGWQVGTSGVARNFFEGLPQYKNSVCKRFRSHAHFNYNRTCNGTRSRCQDMLLPLVRAKNCQKISLFRCLQGHLNCSNVGEKLAVRGIVWLSNGKERGVSRQHGSPLPMRLDTRLRDYSRIENY